MHPFNYVLLRLNYTSTFWTVLSIITNIIHYNKKCPTWKFYKLCQVTIFITWLLNGIICITKHQHLFCFPTYLPTFCHTTPFFIIFTIFNIHTHLFLYNLTLYDLTNISKSIYNEKCRLEWLYVIEVEFILA